MLLVTGMTGHSGQYFLHRLIDEGYKGHIRCLVRPTSDCELLERSGLNIEIVEGDLSDEAFIAESMKNVTEIISIFGIIYSEKIIEQAIAHGVKRAILVHTCGMYSKHKSASRNYQRIEKRVKELVSDTNMHLTILRPTMIYGNPCDQNVIKFIKMIDRFKIIPLINRGNELIQPVYASDLGNAYYEVLINDNTKNKDYDLSGSEPISLSDFFKLIACLLDKKRFFISVPMWVGVMLAYFLKVFTLGKIDYIEKVLRLGEDRSRPHMKALEDFGYKTTPFEEGLRREINLYKSSKKKVVTG